MLFVRKLTENERQKLADVAISHAAYDWAQRARIVLLSAQGRSVPEIGDEVNLHPINVRKWIHRFNAYGVEGLQSGKSPGRPPVFSEEHRDRVLSTARKNPRDLGPPFDRWSLQRLRDYLIERQLVPSISAETVRLILWSHGLRYNMRQEWRTPFTFAWLEEFEGVRVGAMR